MGNGMSFKAGRDMPPGMQEKMTLQIAAGIQKDQCDPNSATVVTAENRKLFDDLRECRNGPEGHKVTAVSAIAKMNELAKEYAESMTRMFSPYIREMIYKYIIEKTAERGGRPQAVLVGPELMMLLLDEPNEICRRADGTYLWRNLPIIEARTREDFCVVWDAEEFKLPDPPEVSHDGK